MSDSEKNEAVRDDAEQSPVEPVVEAAVQLEKTPEAARVVEPSAAPAVPEVPAVPASTENRAAGPVPVKSAAERLYPVVLVAAAIFAVAAIVLGVLWRGSAADLNALRGSQSDRDTAAQVARDYTLRSLTYDYKNMPAFFEGVQSGTSEALRGRYDEVHDTLTKIMTEAQVVAAGQVVGTSVEAKDNDQYAVTVYATQRTQNVQQVEPATKPNLLVVTVAKSGGDWLVVDYGPKDAGTKDGAAK